MTTKFKILSSVAFIALAVVLTFVGVWALTDLDFSVGGNITYTAPKPQIDLKQDANGFYVTMGTYNNADVVWRLVGLNGNKFTGSTAPTSGTGTFILETYINIVDSYDNDGDRCDYATSDMTEFLRGEYLTELNLENDVVYSSITPRDMQNLYANIGWNSADGTIYSINTTSTLCDKLWLMSVAEIYTMVGGGIMTDNIVPSTWDTTIQTNVAWGSRYWLRSTNTWMPNYITGSGEFDRETSDCTFSLRPAFNLEF